jgi:uncharacterized lipoprotein YbaY
MIIKKILLMFLLSLTIFLTGCGKPRNAAVTGLIDHPHSMTLPVGTVMTVQLVETKKGGTPGKEIAEEVFKNQDIQIPMQFIVVYDRGNINENRSYSITVKIKDSAGKLLYSDEKDIPVITQGNPTQDIDVFVVLVDG